MSHVQHTEDDHIERLARRRAGAKMGWHLHALVYLCVNAGLALIAWQTGRAWAIYPLAGWGLGLALHGVAVWLLGPAASLRERLVETEVRRLREREARR
ncbi:MAG: 2TM domain-containing protein [Ottowia sp.]|uniref:2TM domain-containing protein n=1 Tax=Ottowia sp. TaxID=1898956 RepID=UPI0039E4868D